MSCYDGHLSGTFLEPRMLEAMFWRQRGLTNAEAALRMRCKPRTVEGHLWRAREMLGVHRAQLDALLVRGGELAGT